MLDLVNFCDLNDSELWLVVRLYIAALMPVILTLYYIFYKTASYWESRTLLYSFIIVALGWEIWLTYGLYDGLPVDERRSLALSCAIPIHINWLLNSLADVLIIWMGLFFIKQFYKLKSHLFKWRWPAFFILLIWFVSQNIYVEAYFYHMQLGSNGDLSGLPLQPLGSWYNPVLLKSQKILLLFNHNQAGLL